MKGISGKQLKKARHVKDITQDEAAKLLGINRSYLSLVENEKVIPSEKLQRRIDHYFGSTVNKFLFYQDF